MVMRAERNCQTFSPLKHTSLYEQVNFYLPSLGTLRVETDWEIFLPGESQRA